MNLHGPWLSPADASLEPQLVDELRRELAEREAAIERAKRIPAAFRSGGGKV